MNEPNLKMNRSDKPLANQESNLTTSSTEAVTSNTMMWIFYMSLTNSSLKFNKEEKITPETI
jgi:hypothetical protein